MVPLEMFSQISSEMHNKCFNGVSVLQCSAEQRQQFVITRIYRVFAEHHDGAL